MTRVGKEWTLARQAKFEHTGMKKYELRWDGNLVVYSREVVAHSASQHLPEHHQRSTHLPCYPYWWISVKCHSSVSVIADP